MQQLPTSSVKINLYLDLELGYLEDLRFDVTVINP